MGMETSKGKYEADERRTQATLLDNTGSMGGKLDVFRGIRDMSEQVIIHLREYDAWCDGSDHLRFEVAAAKDAIKNLEAVSANTQVFLQGEDTSRSRGFFARITPEGRLQATPQVSNAASGQFQVDVDWDQFKKAISKAARQPKATV